MDPKQHQILAPQLCEQSDLLLGHALNKIEFKKSKYSVKAVYSTVHSTQEHLSTVVCFYIFGPLFQHIRFEMTFKS